MECKLPESNGSYKTKQPGRCQRDVDAMLVLKDGV
jgi:hypothetical protein